MKEKLIKRLEKILNDIGIINPEIDKLKNDVKTQSDKIKLGALITKIMALEAEFKVVCSILQIECESVLEEVLTVEMKAKLDSLQYALGGMVEIKDGKIEYYSELKKILENGN
jgi:hypothetical protein